MAIAQPATRPANPRFSSGPCAKIPTFELNKLADAALGRSHRAAIGKDKLKAAIEETRDLLGVPADYKIGIVPASDFDDGSNVDNDDDMSGSEKSDEEMSMAKSRKYDASMVPVDVVDRPSNDTNNNNNNNNNDNNNNNTRHDSDDGKRLSTQEDDEDEELIVHDEKSLSLQMCPDDTVLNANAPLAPLTSRPLWSVT